MNISNVFFLFCFCSHVALGLHLAVKGFGKRRELEDRVGKGEAQGQWLSRSGWQMKTAIFFKMHSSLNSKTSEPS